MSWHFSQEPEAGFSVENYLAGIRSGRLKSKSIRAKSYCNANEMVSCRHSQSGTTCGRLMARPGKVSSTSFPEVSPVKTSAQQDSELGLKEKTADYGKKCCVSFAKYARDSHSWRIHPCLFTEDSLLYLETWPRLGMMRHGVCSELLTSEHRTDATAFGYSGRLLPTPMVNDAKNNGGPGQQRRHAPQLGAIVGGAPNPPWVEWLLGWPTGWTDLKPLATDRFHQWQRQHS